MNREDGFTLVELSIVILIMGLLIGGLAMPLSAQLENGRIRETRGQIAETEAAIQGFAIINGHLPCPAIPNSDGLSAIAAGGCAAQHGFVPASTLGLVGSRNADNLLLDAWANPLRYSVSNSDIDGDGDWDFVAPGEMRDVSIPLLRPDLVVCSAAAGASALACSGPSTTLTNSAPVVVFSMGKDWASSGSADQQENVGTTLGGGPSGTNYQVASNVVFVNRRLSNQVGSEFDDIVFWSSSARLYHRLVEGGQLP